MPQSLDKIVLHIVFSTHQRHRFIEPEWKGRLHAYLSGVARNTGCQAYRVGGMADHVHLAIALSRKVSVSSLVEELKTTSSKWIKSSFPHLEKFSWQRGYGVFSVGPQDLPALVAYIDDQEQHHRVKTFQEEYRMFLQKYAVDYDEAYVWD